MSSIYQRESSDVWYYQTRYTDPDTGDTKQIRKSLKTKDRVQAQEKKKRLDRKYQRIEDDQPTLRDLIPKYISHRERRRSESDISDRTLKTDRSVLENILSRFLEHKGGYHIRELGGFIQSFIDFRTEKDGVKMSTISQNLRHISAFFGWIEDRHAKVFNPFDDYEIPQSATRTVVPTKKEYYDIIEKSRDFSDVWDKIIHLMAKTGMRIGEVIILKWEREADDFGANHADNYAYLREEDQSAVVYSKRGLRSVPVSHVGYVFKSTTRSGRYVFSSTQREHHYDKTWAVKSVSKRLKEYGYGEYTSHTLRHAFITDRLRRGVGTYILGQIVGHSSEFIMNRYQHLVTEDLEGALKDW